MPTYKVWTEKQIRDWMTAMEFKEIKIGGTKELVFERLTANVKIRIRVYTSIVPGASSARAVGKDAGRVVLVANGSNKPVWKAKRVHRTAGFLLNLRKRCREAYLAVSSLKQCPKCDGFMIERRKRGEHKPSFLGCAEYPECKGTRNL